MLSKARGEAFLSRTRGTTSCADEMLVLKPSLDRLLSTCNAGSVILGRENDALDSPYSSAPTASDRLQHLSN